MNRITFTKGQPVYWPHAIDGMAQVDDLLRRRVRIVYRCRGRRLCFRTLPADRLAAIDATAPPLFPLPFNPLKRGILPTVKPKTYCSTRKHTPDGRVF